MTTIPACTVRAVRGIDSLGGPFIRCRRPREILIAQRARSKAFIADRSRATALRASDSAA